MKKAFIISALVLLSFSSYCQILLEDKDGDKIVNNFLNTPDNNFSVIKLATGDQSLGFDFFTSTKNHDPAKYKMSSFGIKAKPTEGYAAVFNSGQFSPGVNFSYSFTQISILANGFTGKLKPIDWGGIDLSYDINKYQLFNKDTSFGNQISAKNFKAFNLGLNYNLLLNQIMIVTFKIAYSRRNNYDDLPSLEIRDTRTYIDTPTSTVRQTSKIKTLKSGKFEEFDAYPLCFSITKATPTDDPKSPNASKLRLGYTVYLKALISPEKPQTDAGVIFFLTSQGKNGVRTPKLGVNIQATDFFDVQKQNNGLLNRLQVGFTTSFSL